MGNAAQERLTEPVQLVDHRAIGGRTSKRDELAPQDIMDRGKQALIVVQIRKTAGNAIGPASSEVSPGIGCPSNLSMRRVQDIAPHVKTPIQRLQHR